MSLVPFLPTGKKSEDPLMHLNPLLLHPHKDSSGSSRSKFMELHLPLIVHHVMKDSTPTLPDQETAYHVLLIRSAPKKDPLRVLNVILRLVTALQDQLLASGDQSVA